MRTGNLHTSQLNIW